MMTSTRQRRRVSASQMIGFGLLLIGVWLLICPSILDYSLIEATGDAHLNEAFVGMGLILGASARLRWPLRRWGIDLSNTILGAWLALAPSIVGYGQAEDAAAASANDVLCGVLTVVLAMVCLIVTLLRRPSRAGIGAESSRPPGWRVP